MTAYGWIVIRRRLSDSTVWSAMIAGWIFDTLQKNVTYLRFVALERSRKVCSLDVPALTSKGKVPANHGS